MLPKWSFVSLLPCGRSGLFFNGSTRCAFSIGTRKISQYQMRSSLHIHKRPEKCSFSFFISHNKEKLDSTTTTIKRCFCSFCINWEFPAPLIVVSGHEMRSSSAHVWEKNVINSLPQFVIFFRCFISFHWLRSISRFRKFHFANFNHSVFAELLDSPARLTRVCTGVSSQKNNWNSLKLNYNGTPSEKFMCSSREKKTGSKRAIHFQYFFFFRFRLKLT